MQTQKQVLRLFNKFCHRRITLNDLFAFERYIEEVLYEIKHVHTNCSTQHTEVHTNRYKASSCRVRFSFQTNTIDDCLRGFF